MREDQAALREPNSKAVENGMSGPSSQLKTSGNQKLLRIVLKGVLFRRIRLRFFLGWFGLLCIRFFISQQIFAFFQEGINRPFRNKIGPLLKSLLLIPLLLKLLRLILKLLFELFFVLRFFILARSAFFGEL